METLANLEAFVRSAECGSFSEAARRLSLTPAAVSRNVAMLERNLGVRLFHRSTRKLTLTEAGEGFRQAVAGNLEGLQAAIAGVSVDAGEPVGTLKVSLPPTFGMSHVMPLLPGFLARHPRVRPEWHFENRHVDLVAEGYDAAIGGGFALSPGIVARTLAPPTSSLWLRRPTCEVGCRPPTRGGSKPSTASSCGRCRPAASGTGPCATSAAARWWPGSGRASS